MDIIKCEAALAAAEQGSLTAAAELLGYTQSGITRMISGLESEIGFPLFIRSKKGVRLTENGKIMLPLFREIVRSRQNAEQVSAEICGMIRGTLTIGCYYSISRLRLPAILKEFRSRYPGVTVLHAGRRQPGNVPLAERTLRRLLLLCLPESRRLRLDSGIRRRAGCLASEESSAGSRRCHPN